MGKTGKKGRSDNSQAKGESTNSLPYGWSGEERDSLESADFFTYMDKLYQANLARLTAGISPSALGTSFFSWLSQLAMSPGRLMKLALFPLMPGNECDTNLSGDNCDVRFHKEAWQSLPWRLFAEQFHQAETWWQLATTNVSGLPDHVERTVSFCVRQILDAVSPSNFVLTNPELFHETIRSGGANLVKGTEVAFKDILEKLIGLSFEGSEKFIPGKDVAITPGRVVFRNHLIELIQYEPKTKTVYQEPLLILPAWIMKYYILDLSPHNSLVKWLVSKGHTVFMVSWRNPDSRDRDLGMDDYYRKGALAALDAVSSRIPNTKIHLVGYCLGGTLAMITAAAMARNNDYRLKSLTLLAAQGDFTDAGELMLFITKSEVDFLKNMMWDQGYLDTRQMAGTFQMLRSYDLIWSKIVDDYMHGKQRGMIDLLAWNADATRMPYKMHSEYLEKLFLNNDFAEGRYSVEGMPVVPENIQVPAFVVSTEKDHVAPWKSVYKIHIMSHSEITFVLTNGGHNAGIVSEPGHKDRVYQIHTQEKDSAFLDPEDWLSVAEKRKGSWWLAWQDWLVAHSTPKRVSPPELSDSLVAAPGKYVLQK
jgi:polyhydroxyalkanoate synthase